MKAQEFQEGQYGKKLSSNDLVVGLRVVGIDTSGHETRGRITEVNVVSSDLGHFTVQWDGDSPAEKKNYPFGTCFGSTAWITFYQE